MEAQIVEPKKTRKTASAPKKSLTNQIVHPNKKRKRAFLVWGTLFVLGFSASWNIYTAITEQLSDWEDRYNQVVDERSVDEGILQLIFDNGYDRNGIQMTEVTVSAYSSTKDQTDSTPHVTASGNNVMVGQIAVSRDLINSNLDFGSIVYLQGLGTFKVEDVMAPRWKKRVDIWVSDRRAASLFGVKDDVTMIWIDKD